MTNSLSIYQDQNLMKSAEVLASSDFVPTAYKGKPGNVLIAMDYAQRLKMPPSAVMQNLDIIMGRPSFSSKFLAAIVNTCGQYSRIDPEYDKSDPENLRCRAVATRLFDNKTLEGEWYSIKIAKDEGLYGKAGSKYKTMPELMLWYRAVGFWVSMHAPELKAGLSTNEEVEAFAPEQSPAEKEEKPKISEKKEQLIAEIEKYSDRYDLNKLTKGRPFSSFPVKGENSLSNLFEKLERNDPALSTFLLNKEEIPTAEIVEETEETKESETQDEQL